MRNQIKHHLKSLLMYQSILSDMGKEGESILEQICNDLNEKGLVIEQLD